LTAAAIYRYMDLISQDSAFTWSVLGDIGTMIKTDSLSLRQKKEAERSQLRLGILSVLSM
jgi:hypothetical protein